MQSNGSLQVRNGPSSLRTKSPIHCEPVRNDENRSNLRIIAENGSVCIWLPPDVIANLLGVSERAVQKGTATGRYTTRRVPSGGRFGWSYEVLLGSLPYEAQIRYWREVAPANEDTGTAITPLSERARRTALLRSDLVQLYLRETTGPAAGGSVVERKKLFVERFNAGEWPALLESLGRRVSYQTLERWRKHLLDAGGTYEALATRYGSDSTGQRARGISDEQGRILLRYLLTPNRLKVSEVIRLARVEMNRMGVPCDQSDKTLRRWIDDWASQNTDKAILAREGYKALNDKVLPYVERSRWDVEAGDLVVADGHQLNFDIVNPGTGRPRRMTFVVVYDFHSGMPLGWEIMPSENTQTIAAAYRRTILTLGFVPKVFYLDNGRAFRAKYFKGCAGFDQVGLTGLFQRLGSEVMHAWAYHGQSKPIERWFGTFSEIERLMPSYRGTSIATKPAHLQRGDFFHRSIKDSITETTSITLAQAHATIAAWIEEYANRPQAALRGRSPLDVLCESIERVQAQPDHGRRIVTPRELDMLMLAERHTTLYRNGIRHFGHWYYSEELTGIEKGRGGTRLLVRYDIHDAERVLVYDEAGTFICEACRTQQHHPAARILGTDQDRARLADDLTRKRNVEAVTKRETRAWMLDQYRPDPTSAADETQRGATPIREAPLELDDQDAIDDIGSILFDGDE